MTDVETFVNFFEDFIAHLLIKTKIVGKKEQRSTVYFTWREVS